MVINNEQEILGITLEEHHKNLELFQLVYYQFYLKASLSSLLALVQSKSTTSKTYSLGAS